MKVILGNATWLSHCRSTKIASVEPEQRKKEGIYEKNISERGKKKCIVKSEENKTNGRMKSWGDS